MHVGSRVIYDLRPQKSTKKKAVELCANIFNKCKIKPGNRGQQES